MTEPPAQTRGVPSTTARSPGSNARIAALEGELAVARTTPPPAVPGATGSGRQRRERWRTIVAALLIVLGCVLAPLSVLAVWSSNDDRPTPTGTSRPWRRSPMTPTSRPRSPTR